MWCRRRMEKIEWSENVTNEILESIGKNRKLLNNVLSKKTSGFVIFKEEIAFFMMPLKDR